MARLPKLALVGRPNVGKSALFNCISQKRIAIVDEAEGITRDRLYADANCFGLPFEVIDTGGIDPRSKAPFNEQIKQQAEIAIEEADTLVLVVDSRVGMTNLDLEVARILQNTAKPLCVAVNKVDNLSQQSLIHEFHGLGIPNMVTVSATQHFQIAELLETALADFEKPTEEDAHKSTRIAIIGRPNVGKSTLINYLLAEERCIVSPIAGTTRDSIDTPFEKNGEQYILMDTAGIRRKNSEHEVVDKFAAIRTTRAIERSDICLLIIDAKQGMTSQEKRIASQIEEAGKACILLFNKWDLVKGFRMEHCLKQIRDDVPFLKHCPILFLSALTGRNVESIIDEVEKVREFMQTRITTSQLNRTIAKAMQKTHPPMLRGKRLRVYYVTQIESQPPTFVLFVNHPDLMTDAYQRYLYNQIRAAHAFTGLPMVLHLRARKQRERPTKGQVEQQSLEDMDLLSFDSDPTLDDGEAATDREGSLCHS